MPSAFIALIIGLAAYRVTRLAGWDEFPLAEKIRAWVIGERWIPGDLDPVEDLHLPGKQPTTHAAELRPAYDRPTLAHLVHCPFCMGWWVSLAHVAAWYVWHPTIYVMFPFAVSGFVGLVAKNLDA